MLRLVIFGILFFHLALTAEALAQGVCVPPEFKLKAVQGKIITTYSKGEDPLEGISVELRKKGDSGPLVAETTTGEDGRFEFTNIRPGKYVIIAKHPLYIRFVCRLIVSKNLKRERAKQQLFISLGVDFHKACGDGFAELRADKP